MILAAKAMDYAYHYPPELLNLLVDTIPRLCRSKEDVVVFFRSAGVARRDLQDLRARIEQNRNEINKFEIARTILTRLNEHGDLGLRPRREVLKRVVEYEDFSTCWPDDQLKAKGLVAEIQRVVNVKDSFTRLNQERQQERASHRAKVKARAEAAETRRRERQEIRDRLFGLFGETNPQARGRALEAVLNDLFTSSGIGVRESFTRTGDGGAGVLEQIDGVIELDGDLYLVEMKWLSTAVDVTDVSRHLVRVFSRGTARGLFISATEFSAAALETCEEALGKTVVALCLLQEIVELLETEGDFSDLLRQKIRAAILDKTPFHRVNSRATS